MGTCAHVHTVPLLRGPHLTFSPSAFDRRLVGPISLSTWPAARPSILTRDTRARRCHPQPERACAARVSRVCLGPSVGEDAGDGSRYGQSVHAEVLRSPRPPSAAAGGRGGDPFTDGDTIHHCVVVVAMRHTYIHMYVNARHAVMLALCNHRLCVCVYSVAVRS